MQYRVHHVSEISKHAFQNLIALWLTIIFVTVAIALLLSAGSAKADIYLALPKAEMVYQPAVIKQFSTFPTSVQIQKQCQPHLQTRSKGIALSDFQNRPQRNAEPKRQQMTQQAVLAIKAYRQCISDSTLKQLASR